MTNFYSGDEGNFGYTLRELDEMVGKSVVINRRGAFYGAFKPNGMLHDKESVRKMINCLQWHLNKIDDEEIKKHNDEIMRVDYPEYYYGPDYYSQTEYLDRNENNRKTKRSRKGFVYLLLSETGDIKIGRTKQLDERIYHFTTKLPYDLELVLYIETDNSHELEKELHDRYADKRTRGEWFDLSEKDVEDIKERYFVKVYER